MSTIPSGSKFGKAIGYMIITGIGLVLLEAVPGGNEVGGGRGCTRFFGFPY